MRAREFLFEKIQLPNAVPGNPETDPLYNLKAIIAGKIKELPVDEKTERILREIEDLLAHVGAGGKKGIINAELQAIQDKDVNRARNLLAKYILSLEMTNEQRVDLFDRWKNDRLINRELLLSPGKHSITEIVIGYDDPKNPAIKELTDDLSQVAALGQGKGEFLLSVMSKNITKLQKGDLEIDKQRIEIKTQDVGSGRFFDQEVRPASGFSNSVETFRKTWNEEIKLAFNKIPATGLKLIDLIELANIINPAKKTAYWKTVSNVLANIFPGMDIDNIIQAMKIGNIGSAKQFYAVANLNYYRSIKTDDAGILFINLTSTPPSFVFFRDASELSQGGLRLHAGVVYPITSDPRNAYPQIKIVTTKHPMTSGEIPTPMNVPQSKANTPAVTATLNPIAKRQPEIK